MNEVDKLSELIKIWHEKGYKQGINAARAEIAELISSLTDDYEGDYQENKLVELDERLANIINKSEETK